MTAEAPKPPSRSPWGARLDRISLWVARLAGRLVPRPSDTSLRTLARSDRPAPGIRVPTAAELGLQNHLEDGRQALGEGRLGDALHSFGQRVEEAPDDPWAWHGRGDALQLLADSEGARAAYGQALALQPQEGLHHMGLANALDALGDRAGADDHTSRALALNPSLSWMRPAP